MLQADQSTPIDKPSKVEDKPSKVEDKPSVTPPISTLKSPEQPSKAVAAPSTHEGEALFNARCASCHGTKGEKKAMNVSAAIGGWDAKHVVDALKGYQNKTYGKKLQGLMTGQVSKLSELEISQLGYYIQTLK